MNINGLMFIRNLGKTHPECACFHPSPRRLAAACSAQQAPAQPLSSPPAAALRVGGCPRLSQRPQSPSRAECAKPPASPLTGGQARSKPA